MGEKGWQILVLMKVNQPVFFIHPRRKGRESEFSGTLLNDCFSIRSHRCWSTSNLNTKRESWITTKILLLPRKNPSLNWKSSWSGDPFCMLSGQNYNRPFIACIIHARYYACHTYNDHNTMHDTLIPWYVSVGLITPKEEKSNSTNWNQISKLSLIQLVHES